MSVCHKLLAFTVGAALMALSIVGADSAQADQITFNFTGRVTNVYGSVFDRSIHRGTLVRGSYTFDSKTLERYTQTSARYTDAPVTSVGRIHNQLGSSFTTSIGNYTFNGSNFYIHIANNATEVRDYDFYVVESNVSSPGIKDDAISTRLLLFDSTATAFSSNQLPLTPPNLSKFEYRNFGVFVKNRSELAYFTATVDSIDVTTVPEPTSPSPVLPFGALLGVVAFGALGAALALMRKHKSVSSIPSNI